MKTAIAPVLIGLIGCALFVSRGVIGRLAFKIGFPPLIGGTEEERIRLFGMIGLVFALISFGIAGLMLIPAT